MTILWLSRIKLKDEARIRAIANLILPESPSREVLAARHKLVWSFFADHAERNRDFLWREDKRGVFYTLSARKPDPGDMFEAESTEFSPLLTPGDRLAFALRANPVRRVRGTELRLDKNGSPKLDRKGRTQRRTKKIDVVMDRLHAHCPHRLKKDDDRSRKHVRNRIISEAGRDWLVSQGELHGFKVETVKSDGYHQHILPRKDGRKPGNISTLDLEGVIRITDPEKFLARLPVGFGSAKAFGCGLMLIRRA